MRVSKRLVAIHRLSSLNSFVSGCQGQKTSSQSYSSSTGAAERSILRHESRKKNDIITTWYLVAWVEDSADSWVMAHKLPIKMINQHKGTQRPASKDQGGPTKTMIQEQEGAEEGRDILAGIQQPRRKDSGAALQQNSQKRRHRDKERRRKLGW